MSTPIPMTMARATPADIDVGMELSNVLDALQEGRVPFCVDEDQARLDRDDPEQLQKIIDCLKGLADRGSLFRVTWGLQTLIDNNVIDLNADSLALHPRLVSLANERDRAVARLQQVEAWYAVRAERLAELAKSLGFWPEVARILANGYLQGHANSDGTLVRDPPTYAQLLNLAQHRATRAEQRAAALPAASQLLAQAIEAETALLAGESAAAASAALQRVHARFHALLDAVPPPPAEHPDDIAVELFCARLKAMVARKRVHGPSGWQQAGINAMLSDQLRRYARQGDPLEVAAIAMYLVARGELIAPAAPEAPAWCSPAQPPTRRLMKPSGGTTGLWVLVDPTTEGGPVIRRANYLHDDATWHDADTGELLSPRGWMLWNGTSPPMTEPAYELTAKP